MLGSPTPAPTAAPTVATSVAEIVARADRPDGVAMFQILLEHAYRGLRVQLLLRGVLAVFMLVAILAVPPARDRTPALVVVALYALWVAGVAWWSSGGGVQPVRRMWVPLLVDILALSAVTAIAGASDVTSWTADLLVTGYFIVPVLAATQLRLGICVAVVTPAVLAYFAVSAATKNANTEPWASILLRTLVIAGIGVGCIALSRVQLSRVLTIGGLAQSRTDLLAELVSIEARERSALAEQLHDGALQYVLAARQDLAEVRDAPDPELFDRIQYALTESATLLRGTVTQLHPAVLDQAGLARAVGDLATELCRRHRLELSFEAGGWPPHRGPRDLLLYGCARELLTNVVKHAGASRVRVELEQLADQGRLVVADDGRGLTPDAERTRLGAGHIGLASLRTRVAAAGGTLTLDSADGAGTTVTVFVPVADHE